MSGVSFPVSATASVLRRAFDHSFTEARSLEALPQDDFLAIRLGVEPYAIRLMQIGRLVAGVTITPIPTVVPHLLGIAGLRGGIVPVYDLRSLLGCSTAEVPRWLVTAASLPLAFAFDAFDGHLRLAHDTAALGRSDDSSWNKATDILHAPDCLRPIVNVPAIIDWITRSMSHDRSPKEQ